MEPPGFMLGPSQFQRESVVETIAQEDPKFAKSSRKCRQSGSPLVFGKPLNRAALDDNVERTRTHRGVQQVADDEINASSAPTYLWTAEIEAMIIVTPLCARHCHSRNVQGGHVEARRCKSARLLRDAIARAQNGSQAILGHHGSEHVIIVDREIVQIDLAQIALAANKRGLVP